MFLFLFRRLILLLGGVVLLILGLTLPNIFLIIGGICLLVFYLLTKKWKGFKRKKKKK